MKEPAPVRWVTLGILGIIVALGLGARLIVGSQVPLDADESVEGIAAFHILHGHFVLMESNARYLGALDSYVLAPFVALFGTTVLAIRICFAIVGAVYVGLMFVLGRLAFKRDRIALLMAAIAAVFPLFALAYGVKARTYGLLLLLEVLCLILAIRLAWRGAPPRPRDWLLFGFVVGLSMWHDVLIATTLFVCVLALLARGRAIGWANLRRGALLSIAAAIVGFAPWLIYNATTRLGSLRHLYTPLTTYNVPTDQAVREVLAIALPIFVGARVNYCGPSMVSTTAVDLALLLLAVAVIWNRRHVLAALARGRFAAIEPVDMIVLIGPLAVLAVTVRWFNALSCEPRYLMPLAVPLVTAFVLLLASGWLLRPAAGALLLSLLAVSVITAQRQAALIHGLLIVPGAPSVRVDLPALATRLENERPQAVWANYWLARPIEYVSGDRIVIGAYGGYIAFPEMQSAALAAPHPSWLFMPGSADIPIFEAACVKRGITYRRVGVTDGLLLYADLSQPLEPADIGFQTQSVSQAN
ncbi:MAG: glycosyltransferase family 39 protein [Candidatus Dormibacteraeota bacterium]|nr:glycosyltransferase family 39 protein [Candidatus Dormibacteraeota bacterium]